MVNQNYTLQDISTAIVDCEHKTAPLDPQGDYFAVGTPAMRGNRINLLEARRISKETFKSWTRRLTPQHGDLLLAREAPVGPVVRIPESENVAPGQRTVLIRPDPDLCDSEYLYYLLVSPTMQMHLASIAEGSTVPHLNVADVRRVTVQRLPRLSEQRAIAEVLGALDDKIAANLGTIETGDQLLSAEFADRIARTRAPLQNLQAIANVNTGRATPEPGGTLRYIDISSVGRGTLAYPEETTWDDAPSRARRMVRRGDTLWSTVRPNRRSHALNMSDDKSLVASTGLAVLTPTMVGFAYLYEATRRPEFGAYLESVAEGSAYPAVRAERFLEAPVPNLPPDHQEAFERHAAPLRELFHSLERENRSLAATRDALLPPLMSGKLRVKDAERQVEAVV